MIKMDITSTDADNVFNYYFTNDGLKKVLEDSVFEYFVGAEEKAQQMIFYSFISFKSFVDKSSYKPIWFSLISFDMMLAKEILEVAIDQKEKFDIWRE